MIRCENCGTKIAITGTENQLVLLRSDPVSSTYNVSAKIVVPRRCPRCGKAVAINEKKLAEQFLLSRGAALMSRNRKSKLSRERAQAIANKRWGNDD